MMLFLLVTCNAAYDWVGPSAIPLAGRAGGPKLGSAIVVFLQTLGEVLGILIEGVTHNANRPQGLFGDRRRLRGGSHGRSVAHVLRVVAWSGQAVRGALCPASR